MLTQDQLEFIIEELTQNKSVIGILITGSYVYGTPTQASDLDIRCLIKDGIQDEKIVWTRFGVNVELFFNTIESVRFYMKQGEREGHGAAIHFWAYGKIVYDPYHTADSLQQEAQEWWIKGRSDGQPWEARKEKYKKYISLLDKKGIV